MRIQLHDNGKHLEFAPLTLTRPVGELRVGILTNVERWKIFVPEAEIGFDTEDYLLEAYPFHHDAIVVNATVIPTKELVEEILALKGHEELVIGTEWIARVGTGDVIKKSNLPMPVILKKRWDLYQKNEQILKSDFELLTKGRASVQLSSTNTIIGNPEHVFLEKGASVEASILNTKNGPIYIGEDAEIMEGSVIRGALAMNKGSVLKLGSKIYGATTLGPYCKVGGEVNNVVFQAYSNKGHDGFLGNSLIGEWCNIGADTNTSNLKNNYGFVKTYSYVTRKIEQTHVRFMGLTMGDHSKTGINTMFNTATVVGVFANIFGSGFPSKYIPSFSWGIEGDRFDFDKAIQSANMMMHRRGKELTEAEKSVLKFIYDSK